MSKKMCFLGVDSTIYEALYNLIPQDTHIQRVTSLANFMTASKQDIHQIDVIVLGTFLREPLHIAQGIRSFDRYIPILILSTAEQYQLLKSKITFCPFLGQDVSIWLSEQINDIASRLKQLVHLTQQKRTYQSTISAVQEQLYKSKQSTRSIPRPTISTHHLLSFLEQVPLGLIIADSNNNVVTINKKGLQTLGNSKREQLIGHPISELVPINEKNRLMAYINCYRYSKQSGTSETIPFNESRANRYLEFSIVHQSYQHFQDGTFILLLQDTSKFIRSQNICERLEKDLQDSRNDFQSVCAAISEAIFLYNPAEKKIIFSNKVFKEFYGYHLEGHTNFMLHQLCQTTVPYTIDDLEYWIEKAQQSDQSICIEWLVMNNWGDSIYVELYIRVLKKLETTCLLFVTRDISDRKCLEDEMASNYQAKIKEANTNIEWQALEGKDLVDINNLVSNFAIHFINLPIEAISETIKQDLCSICTFAGVDYAYLEQYDPASASKSKLFQWRLNTNNSSTNTLVHAIQNNKWLKQEVNLKTPLLLNQIDPLKQPELKDLHSLGMKSLIAIPLCTGTQITGLVCLGSLSLPHEWTETDTFLLKRTAEIFSEVLQHQAYAMTLNATESLMLEANNKLYKEAHQDELTGIPNRRFFDEMFESEACRAIRGKKHLSILLCDIDYFKKYNDSQGHLQGDHCLRQVAKAMESSLKRSGEFIARVGGEEFIAVLSDTQAEDAQKTAEKLRQTIWDLNIPHLASEVADRVTISIGISTTIVQSLDTSQLLLSSADEALYQAKEQGRNCVSAKNG